MAHPAKAPSAADSILGKRLPDDARYSIHQFMTPADIAAYSAAMGRFGRQVPVFDTPQGAVQGLSARKIIVQTGRLPQEYETVKVGAGHQVYVLPKHQPVAVPFAERFQILRKAEAFRSLGLLVDAFEGLKTCRNLTPNEKRELIEFVLRSQPLMLPVDEVVKYLVETNAFEAATGQQIEGLLRLAVHQTEGRYPSTDLLSALTRHLRRVDDHAVTGFDSIHPDFLGQILTRLAGGRETLEGYRMLAAELPDRVFTAPVVSELLFRLSINLLRSDEDFSNLAPLFGNNELRTELNGLHVSDLRRLAVRAIGSKNPQVVQEFSRALASQDLFHVVKLQFEVEIEHGQSSPAYKSLLRQAVATEGRFT